MNNMKTLHKNIFIIGIVLVVAITSQTNMALAVTDRTVSVAGTATKPVTPGPLLDDFRYAVPLNIWSVGTGTFSSSQLVTPPTNEICTASYINDANAYSGYSMKLDYNVSALNSYAGYSSQLAAQPLNGYTAVSFYVKGAAGGEFFKIQLKNNSEASYTYTNPYDGNDHTNYYRNDAAVYITDHLDGGVTTNWQKVTIPLHNFANLDNFSSMKEFVIVFENAQSNTNGSLKYGTIYIDDIKFENIPVTAVRVDPFGDKLGVCALGGGIGTGVGDGASEALNKSSFSALTNEFSPFANGLKIEYDVDTGFAYTFLVFGGGNDFKKLPAITGMEKPDKAGWIPVPHDFSAYTKLTFRIRATSTTKNPEKIKVELVDNADVPRGVEVKNITTSWTYYSIPLDGTLLNPGFENLDKSSIKQLTFVFENWRVADKSGVILVDSIQFE